MKKNRGRPKTKINKDDKGTPELLLKRRTNATCEVLDFLLQKKLIIESQHRAALHFRWLYTLKFGIKKLTVSYDDRGSLSQVTDEEWRIERQSEYDKYAKTLNNNVCYREIMNICILNIMPGFLKLPTHLVHSHREWNNFHRGLEILKNLPDHTIKIKKTV